ncbi:MAG: hypothetical protein OSB39_13350, partial [Opitutales bacterium]|nr:hypothetical protein [Opitutales bacterium]
MGLWACRESDGKPHNSRGQRQTDFPRGADSQARPSSFKTRILGGTSLRVRFQRKFSIRVATDA